MSKHDCGQCMCTWNSVAVFHVMCMHVLDGIFSTVVHDETYKGQMYKHTQFSILIRVVSMNKLIEVKYNYHDYVLYRTNSYISWSMLDSCTFDILLSPN